MIHQYLILLLGVGSCICQTFNELPYRDQLWVMNMRASALEHRGRSIQRSLEAEILRATALATTGRPRLKSPLFDKDYKPDPKANQISLRQIYGPPETPDDIFSNG